jgi:hypothetical protein
LQERSLAVRVSRISLHIWFSTARRAALATIERRAHFAHKSFDL